ncbi:DUF6356 family protein [Pandoraea sp.]|uniref:DUF6356 family protein n=1 Tax=Pandoraea sp. TaxID=1883445 RepID=UPI001216E710|nr:DUF6356 family protein [Pandoraea sp.]MDE2288419.1 capsule biosynthesis protein [Burkholderiales bacterium]MDE2608238.1 capsule biosynthesis protein [Burkholderiales bacterium]TAL57221.1 MAG: capsule biosynthesis protein [Pandoraea sp.]TAM16531.1 MAG: capsule biosynthesis protein [Pandoraea sp.]
MNKLSRLFKEHPASVGESYWQHMGASFSFCVPMLLASLAAIVHGFFPFLFVKTGSNTVARLHERMVVNRARTTLRQP